MVCFLRAGHIYIYYIDKNFTESTTVCSLTLNYYWYVIIIYLFIYLLVKELRVGGGGGGHTLVAASRQWPPDRDVSC